MGEIFDENYYRGLVDPALDEQIRQDYTVVRLFLLENDQPSFDEIDILEESSHGKS